MKMRLNKNQQAFFKLLRAGLWEDIKVNGDGVMVHDSSFIFSASTDWQEVYRIAEEQSVIGLIAAGLEHVQDMEVPKLIKLQFVGDVLLLEQHNKAMSNYIGGMIDKMRDEGIYALLVKGQGIAQCYKRPLWRACGDVDLLLDEKNYEKAKSVLVPMAKKVGNEYKVFKHLGLTMEGGFIVELHGTLHSRLSERVDNEIDAVQNGMFCSGNVRSWQNGKTEVFLPGIDDDIIFIFTHILHHFYLEGIGLRQICDWCRFLWTYRASLDLRVLESRIRRMGLMSEWKAFGAFAVNYLGMPVEAMPLFNENDNQNHNLHRKADHIMDFVLEVGNFGHNRESAGGKIGSAWSKMKDFARHARVFPWDSVKFFIHFLGNGIQVAKES